MKKVFILVISLFIFTSYEAQEHNYKVGEFLKYKIHYGPLNAGISTIEIKESKIGSRDHFHIIGKGWTTGIVKTFFKVVDRYESYIDKGTGLPSKFIRKIDEGGYIKDKELIFNHSSKQVFINNKKHKKTHYINFKENNIQDMISAFYYLRDYDTSKMKAGEQIDIKIFMDEEEYTLKLKILGREYKQIKNIGNIECLKIRPYVASGRVFKEKESVTVWVTNDRNHIPVEIKASLAVGSLKASLIEYKNLKHTLVFK
ncbi:MAG: DUF3108 domain-containing protein [Flavobacteriales bacterium]